VGPTSVSGTTWPSTSAASGQLDCFDFIEDPKIANGPLVDVLTAKSLHGSLTNAWVLNPKVAVSRCAGERSYDSVLNPQATWQGARPLSAPVEGQRPEHDHSADRGCPTPPSSSISASPGSHNRCPRTTPGRRMCAAAGTRHELADARKTPAPRGYPGPAAAPDHPQLPGGPGQSGRASCCRPRVGGVEFAIPMRTDSSRSSASVSNTRVTRSSALHWMAPP
jgi:hypothetical protein